ncbi:MAG: 50S ribosomal protein L4 [Antricoccus sp.]
MTNLTLDVLDTDGKKTGSVDLPEAVFDARANVSLMHQVVVAQLAAKRQGTSKSKDRGETRGGGAKPYRQKGTGRARQGSTRAPQFVGGGTVHGPQPRSYAQKTPKKMKAAALRGALSDRARGGLLFVISQIAQDESVKTKAAVAAIRAVTPLVDTPKKRVLVVLGRDDLASWVSLRNVPNVHLLVADQLNTYDVLVSDAVVFTRDALGEFLEGKAVLSDSAPQIDQAPASPDATDEAPYGEGSHGPLADDAAPEGFDIKGNADSMLYHLPGTAFYDRTIAEVWFDSAQRAEAAGFALPPSQSDKEEGDK